MSKREIVADFVGRTRVSLLCRKLRVWSGVLALNWHRIGDGSHSSFDRSLWSATPEAFEAQVRNLKKTAEVITPADLSDVFRKGYGRYVLLTFDDGYRDNYENAFPILKAHGVPATFFISTGFIDRPRPAWWDEIAWMVRHSPVRRLQASTWLERPISWSAADCEGAIAQLLKRYKDLPGHFTKPFLNYLGTATGSGRFPRSRFQNYWMTWDMIREMRRAGMVIGGHTVNHPVLARLSAPQQAEEVIGCGTRLAEELGEPMRYFSYPVGYPAAYDKESQHCLVRAGVEYAFSYHGGYCRFGDCSRLNLPRTPVERYFSPSLFQSIVTFPQFFA